MTINIKEHAVIYARDGKWPEVKEYLESKSMAEIPKQDLNDIFEYACQKGKIDILRLMYDKSYAVPPEIGLVILHHVTDCVLNRWNKDIVHFLINTAKINPTKCLTSFIAKGSVQRLIKMQESGADILDQGRSFTMAITCNKANVMEYLYDRGADLYKPEVLIALESAHRRYNIQTAANFYRQLVQQDGAIFAAESIPATLADFARAGQFQAVIDDTLKGRREVLQTKDILAPDDKGVSVLGILTARQELSVLFNAKVWYNRQQEALKVYQHLEDFKALHHFDISHAVTEMQQHALRQNPRHPVRITR
jgi:hypothetical protein